LIIGFGLGPTVPVTMTWTSEIFSARHGEVGVAAATALVSGLGNLGSIVTTYALYTGWEADSKGEVGGEKYRGSNLVCVGLVGVSVLACLGMTLAVRMTGGIVGREGQSGGKGGEAVGVEGEEVRPSSGRAWFRQ